ncbi:MAG: AarF/ABC1/UbiB kinase family protein [Dehalococcoidia bacterium]|nr:AarF/ABC1/UbiB kinase family protein [Dehalococcoidia bacterium]
MGVLWPVSAAYRRAERYGEIANILARHGFGYILDQSGVRTLTSTVIRRLAGLTPESRSALSVPQRLRRAIEDLGPTAIKLGQFLSTRLDLLPEEFIRELESLQDDLPAFPCEQVRTQIEAELGQPVEELFAAFEAAPFAAASLAQVHQARLNSGEEVVVKVQRPGIEGQIEVDLAILANMASRLERRAEWARLWGLVDLVEELGSNLRDELDFRLEGRNADLFQGNLRNEQAVRIPRVYWNYTARRVITMERVSGVKIADVAALEAMGIDRAIVARTFTHVILGQMLIDGFFHGDPHPGNVLVDNCGRIAFMDFGMVGELDDELRAHLVKLTTSLIGRDFKGMVHVILAISTSRTRVDARELQRDLARLLRRYYRFPMREVPFDEVINQAIRLLRKHHLQVPSDLMLLVKSLITVEGIVARLDPKLSIIDVAEPFGRELLVRRLSAQGLTSVASAIIETTELALKLPRHVTNLMEMLERGEFSQSAQSPSQEEVWFRRETLVNRLSLSIVMATGFIGTALLFQAEAGPTLWGMPLLAVGGLLATLALGATLVLSILRSGRL